jgi:NAD(P)H-dependent FMN reductase
MDVSSNASAQPAGSGPTPRASLGVIIASTRQGRLGLPVATWFLERAREHGAFAITVLDLAELELPLLQEPNHPRLGRYQDARTKAWSALVAPLDAFVIVTPEYNFSSPPALVNALDHLDAEWHYKPVGFVSYGGISGGTRSVEATKHILSSLKMVALTEAVNIGFVAKQIDPGSRRFVANEVNDKAAATLLAELVRWTAALRVLRTPANP